MSDPQKLPPIAAIQTFRVPDYEAWRTTFDKTAHVRRDVGILGHHLSLSVDDPTRIYLYMPASDRKRLEQFLGSPELKERQRAAGLTDVELRFVVPLDDRTAPGAGPPAAALVSHDVEDYARWKEGFDAHAETRRRGGIVGHAVCVLADHPHRVVLLVQGESTESLRAFFGSSGLREAMKRAGVTSEPTIEHLRPTGHLARYAD